MTTRDLNQLEQTIGRILRVGVMLSAASMVIGLVMMAAGAPAATRVLNGGLILLMMIPSTRIIVSLIDAIYRRDKLLAISTAIVTLVIAEEVFKKLFLNR